MNNMNVPIPSLWNCPYCNNKTPVYSPNPGNPGDFGIAICCGETVVINDYLEIQSPTEFDWSTIDEQEKEIILQICQEIKALKREYETKRNCPSCGIEINIIKQIMNSALSLNEVAMPRCGDFGICSSCNDVYIFGENAENIRSATQKEIDELVQKDKTTANLLMSVLQTLKKANFDPKMN